LLLADDHQLMATAIASQANEAYLQDMNLPQLETWVAQSGLSKAELAQIQPIYPCPDTCVTTAQTMLNSQMVFLAQVFITGALAGLGTCLVNILTILRKRWLVLLPVSALGVVLGAALFYIGHNYLFSSVTYAIAGYVHCPGAGVGNVCNPGSALVLDESFKRLIGHTLLIGTLIFGGNCLVLVKALRRETFGSLTLLTTIVTVTIVGMPLLFFLSGYFNQGNIFDGLDRMGFATYLLIVAAGVGLLMWLLGLANQNSIRPDLYDEVLPPAAGRNRSKLDNR
jgi:hypothetical protein